MVGSFSYSSTSETSPKYIVQASEDHATVLSHCNVNLESPRTQEPSFVIHGKKAACMEEDGGGLILLQFNF